MSSSRKRLLVTGFEPFGGQTVNPAWEAVSRLPEVLGNWQLFRRQIPTVFGEADESSLRRRAFSNPTPSSAWGRRARRGHAGDGGA